MMLIPTIIMMIIIIIIIIMIIAIGKEKVQVVAIIVIWVASVMRVNIESEWCTVAIISC